MTSILGRQLGQGKPDWEGADIWRPGGAGGDGGTLGTVLSHLPPLRPRLMNRL